MPYVECEKLDMLRLGEKLRAWRIRHGYSQEQLAASMQLSGLPCDGSRISAIERGRVRMSIYECAVLVLAFGIDIRELF